MKTRDLMTEDPIYCTMDDRAQTAAQLMLQADCGCLPVISDPEDRRIVGVVTDRDLAVRGLAAGSGPETPVRELMSKDPRCCSPESDLDEVREIMTRDQVRRVPVVDERGNCVGMISQADLARAEEAMDDHDLRRTVEEISEPNPRIRA